MAGSGQPPCPGAMSSRRLAGFDAWLETCEDVDLCNRMRAGRLPPGQRRPHRSAHLGDPATLRALFFGELWRGRDNLRVTLRGPLTLRAPLPSVVTPVFNLACMAAAGVGALAAQRGGLWLTGAGQPQASWPPHCCGPPE